MMMESSNLMAEGENTVCRHLLIQCVDAVAHVVHVHACY